MEAVNPLLSNNTHFTGSTQLSSSIRFEGRYQEPFAWHSLSNTPFCGADQSGTGTSNAALSWGGFYHHSDAHEYNGTSWSNINSTPTSQFNGGRTQMGTTGTVNAAFGGGGQTGCAFGTLTESNITHEYNGSSWSSGPNTPNTSRCTRAVGTCTAALFTFTKSTGICTHEYNGTSWSSNVSNGVHCCSTNAGDRLIGTQNAAHLTGGGGGTGTNNVSFSHTSYNGTSWSSCTDLPTAKCRHGAAGVSNGFIEYGGYTGIVSTGTGNCWNGSAWSALSAVLPGSFERERMESVGSGVNALSFGGYYDTYNVYNYYQPEFTNAAFDYRYGTGLVALTGSYTGSFTGNQIGGNTANVVTFEGGLCLNQPHLEQNGVMIWGAEGSPGSNLHYYSASQWWDIDLV